MKCWNLTFDAQVSKLIIVDVQVGAMNIYVAIVEVLKKKEWGGQNRMKLSLPQNWCFSKFHLLLNANIYLLMF
jgi:hypothetical protein